MKLNLKAFLTGEELSAKELGDLLDFAHVLKRERDQGKLREPFKGKTLALLFEKPSLRTRFSFAIAIQELGGYFVESLSSTSKREEPEDMAKVLNGYVHAVMWRTHDHENLVRMVKALKIPLINGLSDTHHPCQVLADLMAVQQSFGKLKGVKLAYMGDGNNMLHSLLLLAPLAGMDVSYSCPVGYDPDAEIVARAKRKATELGAKIESFKTPEEAVSGAHAIYTDVWTSMGFEGQNEERERAFASYQLNEEIYSKASGDAVVMHCLPMMRGKEITDAMADHPRSILFRQSENRLHVQKALLVAMLGA
ncbi:MAG: ornithine carbamoyltransferase [Xanthomonadaceae bacterium]|nr:ornithine carbamoyltransferase [Xanthomonadaceae bacterium]